MNTKFTQLDDEDVCRICNCKLFDDDLDDVCEECFEEFYDEFDGEDEYRSEDDEPWSDF